MTARSLSSSRLTGNCNLMSGDTTGGYHFQSLPDATRPREFNIVYDAGRTQPEVHAPGLLGLLQRNGQMELAQRLSANLG
jgi:hypothetical protein